MPIAFCQYSQIKDNYCFAYFGPCNEYIVQLLYIRPFLEEKFQGTKIFISCKDELSHLTQNQENIIFRSQIKDGKKGLSYIREITCNMKDHPIDSIINECDIQIPTPLHKENNYKKCVIYPNGTLPTQSLNDKEINSLKSLCLSMGYEVVINSDLQKAGLVAGVENEYLFTAAVSGIKTILVDTGIGGRFYKKIFCPPGEIFN